MSKFTTGLLAASLALALSGCGPSEEERRQAAQAQAAQAAEAQAAEQLALYEDARGNEQWETAMSLGNLIVQSYPDTEAARQLQATYPEVEAQAAGIRETRRLEGLWVYHAVEEGGATSRTAYIFSEAPERGMSPVRLVLRAHAEWGDSVYLLPEGDTPRFRCANPCDIEVRFDDGEPQTFEAVVSEPTENHALFIDDFDAFLAGMDAAASVRITAQTEGENGLELSYEVAGFNAERFAEEPAAGE